MPYKLVRKKEEYVAVQNSGGLVSAVLSLSEKIKSDNKSTPDIIWVGTGDKDLGSIENASFKMFPIEIPKKVNEKYYSGFCNNTIWPLFHYFPSRTIYDPDYFEAYQTANNLFFRKITEIIEPGDLIWIHDYQLFLLPGLLRDSFPKAGIGFFLHIPFPSFEIVRLIPRSWREMILKGMLGSDVVGFHTNDYTQHFIKSIKRTLGYKIDQNFISVNGRLCKADSFPLGIDFEKFHNASSSNSISIQKKKIKAYLSENKLIFSIDRLDYSKGLLYRLRAFERFLEKYPEWHFKIVFNMVIIPSRDMINEYRELKKEIEATVGRLNGKYSTLRWRPIIYQYKSVPYNEMIAIYSLSDVGFITPLRDGMNLVSKEYIACQNEHMGMLILSEMAGASSELNEAIIINPTDIEETADALDKALIMPQEEKEKRIRKMQNRLSRYDVFKWTIDFFDQIENVKREKSHLKVRLLDNSTIKHIQNRYHESKKRLFLIDYDGTLTPIVKIPDMAVLDKNTREILKDIISDPRNTVIIISGRSREFIDEQFRGINVTLIAEHGFFSRYPGNDWTSNIDIDLSWKDRIRPVLNDYVDRCNGSMVEEKYSSLAWHYRNADEDIALLRINELKDDLDEILQNEPILNIVEGNKVLEVKSVVYNKGTIASKIINKENYDFIIALGDDSTDEDLFKVIPENGFTIRVGCMPTNARFSIRDQSEAIRILSLFCNDDR